MDTSLPQWQLIESADELESFLQRHENVSRCAIDLEADSLHRYGERICLVQVECAGEIVLVDPLADGLDASRLYAWMRRRDVWMHGADYDMRLLQAAGAELPEPLYDTQIAAQLVGRPRFGLASLIEEEFGVALSKASQKADWAKRPLPQKMLVYAAYDVHFLEELADRLIAELHEKGRHDWFLESCASARAHGLQRSERDPDSVWRISGWGKLSRRGLAYLRAVWHWRDDCAASWDRPVFYLANNQKLLDWAIALENGRSPDLAKVRSRWRKSLDRAIAEAAEIPTEDLPRKRLGSRGPRRGADWESQFERLRSHRNRRAKELGIDSGVLASRAVLEGLVSQPEAADRLLMKWQRQVLQL